MEIAEHVDDILLKIVENFTPEEIIITGGVSDYFNYKKNNFENRLIIKDVDVVICDKAILTRLETVFNNSSSLIFENNIFGSEQYYLWVNENCYFDVFLVKDINIFNSIGTNKYTYKEHSLSCTNYIERYNEVRGMFNDIHNSSEPFNKKLFKYLKKSIIYRRLINNGL